MKLMTAMASRVAMTALLAGTTGLVTAQGAWAQDEKLKVFV